METLGGVIDQNDLEFIRQRYGEPLLARPCPIKNRKINPHVSRFMLKDGTKISLFHIKPIYYLHRNGEWRPLSEVASDFGNSWINLKDNWMEKMDVRYLNWLLKRMEIVKGKLKSPAPYLAKISNYAR